MILFLDLFSFFKPCFCLLHVTAFSLCQKLQARVRTSVFLAYTYKLHIYIYSKTTCVCVRMYIYIQASVLLATTVHSEYRGLSQFFRR